LNLQMIFVKLCGNLWPELWASYKVTIGRLFSWL